MPSGRPSIMTPAVIDKLEGAYLLGCTDQEATLVAGISMSTLYNYQEKHPEFVDRKGQLKKNPIMLARGVVVESLKDGDKVGAHKVLDREEGSKVKISGDADSPLVVTEVIHRVI